MALYSANNTTDGTQQNLSSSFKTAMSLRAITATLRRAYIYEFNVGTDGAPNSTDCSIVWSMDRQTADGTATASTPTALDAADAASGSQVDVNYTGEGTITADTCVWVLAANQRASYRWCVCPCGPGEIVIPATNDNGYALRAKSATYASTVATYIMFRE